MAEADILTITNSYDTAARFWTKVKRAAGDGCWIWTAYTNKTGYGEFKLGRRRLAHRVAWALANGPLRSDVHVLHRCDVPPCVRPSHLFCGDDATNAADRKSKGRNAYKCGESNPNAKLSAAQVAEMRASSLHPKVLAERYGVSISHTNKILRGAKWPAAEARLIRAARERAK